MRTLGDPTTMPVDELNRHHHNPRRGDVNTIIESIKANGLYKPLIVNRGNKTGRPNEILAGNHTYQAAKQLGMQTVPVWVIDVDEEQATKIVLADNRTADLGGYDNDILLELLDDLDGSYLGTGYDEDDIGRLLGEEIPDDWQPDQPLADPDLTTALIALGRTNPDTVITFNQPGNLQQLVEAAHASGWRVDVNTDRLKIWPSMRS